MPSALLKACTWPGRCPELVESGRCPEHARAVEQRRGSAASRGYTWAWTQFRGWFMGLLVAKDVAPACGASLPGGPDTGRFSRCVAEGVVNDRDLHLDHEPPLTDAEREVAVATGDRARVIRDPKRVGFLCARCHSRKTRGEQARGVV